MCGLRWCQGLFVEGAENLYAGGVARALLLTFCCSPWCLAYFGERGGEEGSCCFVARDGGFPRDLDVEMGCG